DLESDVRLIFCRTRPSRRPLRYGPSPIIQPEFCFDRIHRGERPIQEWRTEPVFYASPHWPSWRYARNEFADCAQGVRDGSAVVAVVPVARSQSGTAAATWRATPAVALLSTCGLSVSRMVENGFALLEG